MLTKKSKFYTNFHLSLFWFWNNIMIYSWEWTRWHKILFPQTSSFEKKMLFLLILSYKINSTWLFFSWFIIHIFFSYFWVSWRSRRERLLLAVSTEFRAMQNFGQYMSNAKYKRIWGRLFIAEKRKKYFFSEKIQPSEK